MSAPPDEPPSTARRTLRVMAAFYLLSYGGLGALFPFLPLLLARRGLDASEISLVMVLIPLTGLLVPPLWGMLADARNLRAPLLRWASLGCGLSALLFYPAWGLWGGLLAIALFQLFRAPVASLADAATYAALDGSRTTFAVVRVWGSAGFGISALLLGQAQGSVNPGLLVLLTSGIYLASAASVLFLPASPSTGPRSVLRQSLAVIRQPAVALFIGASATYYVGHGSYDAYFGLYMQELGLDDRFVGQAWALGVAAEIVLMLLAPRVLPRLRSEAVLVGCSAIAALRWALLALLRRPFALLLSQSLHGLTFGVWYLALVHHIQVRAPEHLRTTLQSTTLSSLGLGATVAYLTGGQMLHHRGGAALYGLAAGAAGLALVLYVLSASLGRRGPAGAPPPPV